MNTVAIVILNWNGKHFLEQCLPSVVRYSNQPGVSIYVADNGSTDGSVDFLEKNYPGIRVYPFEKNHGFAEGYNKAMLRIDEEFSVLLNSDAEVSENWLQQPIDFLKNDLNLAACMPKIRSWHEPSKFEHAGAAGGFIDKYGYTFCRGRIFDSVETDTGQYDTPTGVFWATGACMFTRTKLFNAAGGFDPLFFAHMEEIDLCWRLQNKGYRLMYCPGSIVYHMGGGTLDYTSPRKTYLNFRNNLILLYKNLPWGKMTRVITYRLILDFISLLRFAFRGDIKNALAISRAHLHFFKAIPNYKHLVRPKAVTTTNPYIYPKSIVFQYFIRKINKFTDLGFILF